MSEFHDPDLRQQLGRLSGPYPDDNAAFAAWQRRVGQARRRRAMAWTTGAALSLIVGNGRALPRCRARLGTRSCPASRRRPVPLFTVSVASTEPETTDPSTTESTVPDTSCTHHLGTRHHDRRSPSSTRRCARSPRATRHPVRNPAAEPTARAVTHLGRTCTSTRRPPRASTPPAAASPFATTAMS